MLCLGLLTQFFSFHVLICIMHSAFNLLIFPNSMFIPLLFFHERAMCSPEKYHLKITIIIIIILVMWLEYRFLDTEVDGSNPASVCCVLEEDTLSALS